MPAGIKITEEFICSEIVSRGLHHPKSVCCPSLLRHMHPASPTTRRLEKKQEAINGGWGEKLWGCQRELLKDKQAVRSRADLSPHRLLPSLSSTPQESLDSSICKLSWTLMWGFFFLFLCFFRRRLFLLPRESGRKPQLLCFPFILQPWQNPGCASLTCTLWAPSTVL